MTVYEQIHKAYIDAKKTNFWDAWGVVASPMTIYKLRAEVTENIVIYTADSFGHEFEKIFGLVVIPCTKVGDDKVYVVDERLGRTILEGWSMEHRDGCSKAYSNYEPKEGSEDDAKR